MKHFLCQGWMQLLHNPGLRGSWIMKPLFPIKILQGKRTKKTLDLIGWFFNGGSNPLGPLFGSRKTHGYPALLMDDILHLQRLDGKVSRMEHLHPSLPAKLHCRNDVNKNQEPPNQNPTRLLSYAPFNLFWYPEGGFTCWFRYTSALENSWTIFCSTWAELHTSSCRAKLHWNHPNIFRFPSIPEDYSWWVNGENL